MKGLTEVCSKIEQQTDENDHTGAKLTIAKFFKLTHFVKVFEAIEVLHDAEGSMPEDLYNYRRRKGIEMMKAIEQQHGTEIHDLIYSAL